MIQFHDLTRVRDAREVIAFIDETIFAEIDDKKETFVFVLHRHAEHEKIINLLNQYGANFGLYWMKDIALLIVRTN